MYSVYASYDNVIICCIIDLLPIAQYMHMPIHFYRYRPLLIALSIQLEWWTDLISHNRIGN